MGYDSSASAMPAKMQATAFLPLLQPAECDVIRVCSGCYFVRRPEVEDYSCSPLGLVKRTCSEGSRSHRRSGRRPRASDFDRRSLIDACAVSLKPRVINDSRAPSVATGCIG